MSPKYPRTPHLPWSPGGTSDDRRIKSVEHFLCRPVVLTEKMDGSNVCMERDACFARSHASTPNHPSFDAFKAMHATVRHLIPKNVQVFGEWLYAKHSIGYDQLPSYFQVFGVRDLLKNVWASWEEVEVWAEELGVVTVPVLAKEDGLDSDWKIQELVESHARLPSRCGKEREGVVLRVAGEFSDADFGVSIAKWVRKDHVTSSDHWAHQVITRNGLV